MKKILLIFCLLSAATTIKAQQPVIVDTTFMNFTVKGGKIFWSRVYEDIPRKDIIKYLYSDDLFILKQTSDSVITGFTRAEILPYIDCGYKPSNITHPLDDQCEVSFRINLKEDRYRVVVSCIKWSNVYSIGIPAGGIIATVSGTETNTLEYVAFKKERFRKFFLKKGAAQLNDVLTYLFSVKCEENIVPEEW